MIGLKNYWNQAGLISLLLCSFFQFFVPGYYIFTSGLISCLLFFVLRFLESGRLTLPKFSPILASLFIGFGFSATIFLLRPFIFFDDAGFVLRYFDNFQQGCFFCYNLDEGPVFGLSGFLFGAVGGLISAMGADPEWVIILLSFFGIGITFHLIFLYLFKCGGWVKALFGWVFIASGSIPLFGSAFCGLETSFHLGIVFVLIWAFLYKKERAFWTFLALVMISKLDAVPLALVCGFFWALPAIRNEGFLVFVKRSLQPIVLFFLFPLALYFAITFSLFGGPLPLSAQTKFLTSTVHSNEFLPILNYYYVAPLRAVMILGSTLAFGLDLVLSIRRKCIRRDWIVGFSGFASFSLYLVYKPNEVMLWYQVLPEVLVLFQGAISAVKLFGNPFFFRPGILILSISFSTTLLFRAKEVKLMNEEAVIIEKERIQFGGIVEQFSEQGDTILTGHGHISRKTKGRVIDYAGLNSKIGANYKGDLWRMVPELKPKISAVQDFPYAAELFRDEGYRIREIGYDICVYYQQDPWLILERHKKGKSYFSHLSNGDCIADGIPFTFNVEKLTRISGNEFVFIPPDSSWKYLLFGIFRKGEPFTIKIEALAKELVSSQISIPAISKKTYPGYTERIILNIPKEGIRIVPSLPVDVKAEIIEPFWSELPLK